MALEVRTAYLNAAGIESTVELTADYGARVYDFTVEVQWSREEGTVLTVREPELISGLTARVCEGETFLEYDGVRLESGALWPDGLSPVDAVPHLMDQICTGFMAECSLAEEGEDPALRVCCRDAELGPGEGVEYVFWFSAGDYSLQRAEVSDRGSTVLFCTFKDFVRTEA